MNQAGDFLKDATIEYGSMIPDNGGMLHLFGLKLSSGDSYWFDAIVEWAENENDYALNFGDFGALGRLSLTYKSFNKTEIMEIKSFLEKYFTTQEIQYFWISKGAKPLAFNYRERWIIEGNGELYKKSYGELRRIAPSWTDVMRTPLKLVGRLANPTSAIAAFGVAVLKYPHKLIFLREKARVIRRSGEPKGSLDGIVDRPAKIIKMSDDRAAKEINDPGPKETNSLTQRLQAFHNSVTSIPDHDLFEATRAYNNAIAKGGSDGGEEALHEEALHKGIYATHELHRRYPNGWDKKYLKWLAVGNKRDSWVDPD